MQKFTIIGGGATGTLLAVNLIKNVANKSIEINLVDKREKLGRGVAYSTAQDFHLLNVPANKMGAFPDQLEHFHNWLVAKGYDFFPNDFVPRRLYGEYLRELLAETVAAKTANVAVNFLDDEAVDVLIDDDKAQVILNSGEILYSDKVVLAFGNFPPPHPKSESTSFVSAEKYFQNPWNAENYEKIRRSDDVFIVGTGLTAIDTVLSLRNNQHEGKIFLFSTRGLLPAVHRLGFVYTSFYGELESQTKITDLLKIVRRHIEDAKTKNSDWRAVIDSLRPHTAEIWRNLPNAEKRYFMQHLSRYWNVARHRMPPECAEFLDEMQAANQLQILKGRLKNIETVENGKFNVSYCLNGERKNLFADAIVNCIGSESNFNRVKNTLVKNLVRKGIIKNDALNLGIDATPDGKTIDANDKVSDKILTAGTALKGILWESTAMPEIRAQANKLAISLLA
jgi:uncharacterized NAD(P)/FAD-binding protein YdhS